MPAIESQGHRLFRHDWRIAVNALRAIFAKWHDRLISGAVLLVGSLAARAWLAGQAWKTAAEAAAVAGILFGIAAGRLVAARLAFHRSDGVLAIDALRARTRRRYLAACHGVGVAMLAAITLIARPSLLVVSAPAYLAGAIVAHMTTRIALPGRTTGSVRPIWWTRRWLRRPGAGFIAALVLLLSLLPTRALAPNGQVAMIGVGALALALALTLVDQAQIRFMAIAGYRPWRIVLRHARPLLLFAALSVPGCWFALGPVSAGIVAASSIAMLQLLAMRVFAYGFCTKYLADLLVSMLVGLLLSIAYSLPVLLPVFVVAILWQLQHRAAARTWLLA